MTATAKVTRADLVAQIATFDPAFSFNKKKHTVEFLTTTLNGYLKPKKGRMADGVRLPTKDEVKVPGPNSKRFAIMSAMAKGCTVEDLLKLTGWHRQSVTSALRTDVRDLGFGYEKVGDTLKLIIPKGVDAFN